MTTVAIRLDDGTHVFTSGTVAEVRAQIAAEEIIRCWWCATHGQRCVEDFFIPMDRVSHLRTESEDQ